MSELDNDFIKIEYKGRYESENIKFDVPRKFIEDIGEVLSGHRDN